MTIYLSGPMSGIKEFNYPAFKEASAILRANGYNVLNPAEIPKPKESFKSKKAEWVWYMKKAIVLLMKADKIVMLQGWHNSKGAKTEWAIAKMLDYEVQEYSEMEVVL